MNCLTPLADEPREHRCHRRPFHSTTRCLSAVPSSRSRENCCHLTTCQLEPVQCVGRPVGVFLSHGRRDAQCCRKTLAQRQTSIAIVPRVYDACLFLRVAKNIRGMSLLFCGSVFAYSKSIYPFRVMFCYFSKTTPASSCTDDSDSARNEETRGPRRLGSARECSSQRRGRMSEIS